MNHIPMWFLQSSGLGMRLSLKAYVNGILSLSRTPAPVRMFSLLSPRVFRRKLLMISPSLYEGMRGRTKEARKDVPLPKHQLSEGVAKVVRQSRFAIRLKDVNEWVRKRGSRRPWHSYDAEPSDSVASYLFEMLVSSLNVMWTGIPSASAQ